VGWHAVVATLLHQFIARQRPLSILYHHLKPGLIVVVVVVTIKMTVDVVGIFYPPLATSRYYSSITVHCIIPFYVAIMYSSILFSLARGGAALAPVNRIIRDRSVSEVTRSKEEEGGEEEGRGRGGRREEEGG